MYAEIEHLIKCHTIGQNYERMIEANSENLLIKCKEEPKSKL